MNIDQDLYKKALDLAARVHGDQKVPGSGFPYVVHVAKVAMEVLVSTENEALDRNLAVVCALLHDTLEDTRGDPWELETEIRTRFGDAVANGVRALTKDSTTLDPMSDSLDRIEGQPREVWLVKLADRITNLEPPPREWTLEKRRSYLAEAKVILERLGSANARVASRLAGKVAEYEVYCA